MTSGITYDGVASDTGGNIFAGMSFWVAQRVPMRNSILEKIKSNGGKIVPLEKNADMLIADHVRKDVPRGSFSWKFIEDSVAEGVLQLEDKYQIGWAPDVQRPAGSNRPVKGTRTPYTAQDDAWLLQWVLPQTGSRSGNKIYMEFAELCPRHTWQSWRERYTKRLALLSADEQNTLAESVPPMQENLARNGQRSQDAPTAQPSPPPTIVTAASSEQGSRKANTNIQSPERRATESASGSTTGDTQYNEMKEQFYNDLSAYMSNEKVQIDTWHTINGKEIELWQLAEAVMAQNVATDETDWLKVSEDLDFNWGEDKTCAKKLRECYDANLAEFIEYMNNLDSQRMSQAAKPNEIPDSLSKTGMPVSPSPLLSAKRSRDAAADPVKSPKRRRLSRDAEIPSTPGKRPLSALQTPSLQPQLSSFDITPSQQLRDELSNSPTNYRTPAWLKRSPPVQTQSTSKQRALSTNDEEIQKWVEHYEALGYSNRIVVRALKATSLTPGYPATHAMQSLQDGNGLPSNAEGIWSDLDDNALRLVNKTDLFAEPTNKEEAQLLNKVRRKEKRLLGKHGQAKVDLRTRYLEAKDLEDSLRTTR